MRMRNVAVKFLFVSLFVGMTGCDFTINPPQITVNAGTGSEGSAATTCTVTLPGGATVAADQEVTVKVDVGNTNFNILMIPPFTVDGIDGSFSAQSFTFTTSFPNATGTTETLTETVAITDSKGGTLACNYTVTVSSSTSDTATTGGPKVTLTASPAKTAGVTSAIGITAAETGFTNSPTFTFATSEAGIGIQHSGGNTAIVTAVDGKAHSSFTITATGTSGSQTANASISLSFTTASSGISCTVQVDQLPSWDYNYDVPYLLVATTAIVTGSTNVVIALPIYSQTRVSLDGPLGGRGYPLSDLWRYYYESENANCAGSADASFTVTMQVQDVASGAIIACTPVTIQPQPYCINQY